MRIQQQPMVYVFAILSSIFSIAFGFFDGVPLEQILGQMGGGGSQIIINGQQMGGAPQPRFPPGVSDKIEQKYDWMINTEWKSGAGTIYTFQRGGEMTSTANGETSEGSCKWAANKGNVILVTPTTMKKPEKVMKFEFVGDSAFANIHATNEERKAAQQALDRHKDVELTKMKLQSLTANKKGKHSVLEFSRIAVSAEEDSTLAADPYELLGIDRSADGATAKKAYRKLSISHHPDRGGDPYMFDQIRMAYEILSDDQQRTYYDVGGALLVKNMETAFKEIESQVAQQLAQLDQQVPKGHPAREQYEAKIKAQGEDKEQIRGQLEKKFTNDNEEIEVEIPMEKLFRGGAIDLSYQRRTLVPGCRDNPDSEKCQKAGRCPPEVKQVPKMQGPFMVGTKQVEVESREKCIEETVEIKNVHVPAAAQDGTFLFRQRHGGSQTPGKIPGDVLFKVVRMAHEEYFLLQNTLHTVLHITHEEALFGFSKSWYVLGDRQSHVSVDRTDRTSQPDEIIKKPQAGMYVGRGQRADLIIRLKVEFPDKPPKEPLFPQSQEDLKGSGPDAVLSAENEVVEIEQRGGKKYREWGEYYGRKKKSGGDAKKKKKKQKTEL